jgi:hypothetical protein
MDISEIHATHNNHENHDKEAPPPSLRARSFSSDRRAQSNPEFLRDFRRQLAQAKANPTDSGGDGQASDGPKHPTEKCKQGLLLPEGGQSSSVEPTDVERQQVLKKASLRKDKLDHAGASAWALGKTKQTKLALAGGQASASGSGGSGGEKGGSKAGSVVGGKGHGTINPTKQQKSAAAAKLQRAWRVSYVLIGL